VNAVAQVDAERIMRVELSGSGYGAKYIRTILKAQYHFLQWAAQRGINDLRLVAKHDLYDYQTHLLAVISEQTGKPLARGTVSDKYGAVKMLFAALCRAGLLIENITSGIQFELPKREGLGRQAFSHEEMAVILEKMDTSTTIGLRDRALFELIYSSGLRVSEAAKLLIKDVDLNRREMIVRGKFARDRIVPVSKIARYYLALYLKDRIYQKDEPVFRSAYGAASRGALQPGSIGRRFSDLLKKYNMKREELSAHSIRHASASHLLENGAGIRHVQELLGHRNLETTARYTHVQGERLTKVYRKYHPQEHDLFDVVDDDYKQRLKLVLGLRKIR
jgi:site-specific recombinase XerD